MLDRHAEAAADVAEQLCQHQRLIGEIGVMRGNVVELGRPEQTMAARMRLFGEAFRPAGATDDWAGASRPQQAALDGVTLIEAANEREEAAAIVLASE